MHHPLATNYCLPSSWKAWLEEKDYYFGHLFLNSTSVASFYGSSPKWHVQGHDGSLLRPPKSEMGSLTASVCLSHLILSMRGN